MTTRSLRFYFIFCFAFCSFNYLLFCNKVMRIVELVLEFSCCNVAARVSYCSLLRSGGAGGTHSNVLLVTNNVSALVDIL